MERHYSGRIWIIERDYLTLKLEFQSQAERSCSQNGCDHIIGRIDNSDSLCGILFDRIPESSVVSDDILILIPQNIEDVKNDAQSF